MLDKFLALLERFVAAHELIAANSGNRKVGELTVDVTTAGVDAVKRAAEQAKEDIDEAKPKRGRKPATKKDPEPEQEPEDEPKPKRGKTQRGVDYKELREQIADIDDALNDGDSNEAVDEFDKLMDDYDAKRLNDIEDEDLEAFLKAAKKIVNKCYEEE